MSNRIATLGRFDDVFAIATLGRFADDPATIDPPPVFVRPCASIVSVARPIGRIERCL